MNNDFDEEMGRIWLNEQWMNHEQTTDYLESLREQVSDLEEDLFEWPGPLKGSSNPDGHRDE